MSHATSTHHRHLHLREAKGLSVLVTGSRGLIGTELIALLKTGRHRVTRLVTGRGDLHPEDGTRWVPWNPDSPLPAGTLEEADAVIHLAGDSVTSSRWTRTKKRKIVESRTIPTRHIAEALAAMPASRRPKVFLCASAVGYYGNRGDEFLTEDSPPGEGFFPDVCVKWEAATHPARDAGIRTANFRIGVVLSHHGGALGKQLFAFKLGLGAVLGSGEQWMPWITVADVVGAIHHCLVTEAIEGPVNLVGPNPATNREFTRTLGHVLHRPTYMWLPRLALRAMFGEIADEALLASMRAVPKKLLDTGFTFAHPDLAAGLRFLLGR
ncbi:MAG TPA: TIGR01777 family oxidoreductase [Gemmata sp.]|nr:TIGR01777 family oxidoreductase [Gemmata sp.]